MPTDEFFKEIESLLFKFLWGEKKDKIARQTIKNQWTDGGLGFPDFKLFLETLRSIWIGKYWERFRCEEERKPYWIRTLEIILKDRGGKFWVLFGSRKLKEIENTGNKFWKEVFNLSLGMNSYFDCWRDLNLNRELLFYNDRIKLDQDIYVNWRNRGIFTIGDILQENGQILSRQELEEKYNLKVNDLEYIGIINAIPREWRVTLGVCGSIEMIDSKPHIEKLFKRKKPNKEIYDYLIRKNLKRPIAFLTWENIMKEEFKENYENIRWGYILNCIKVTIPDLKIREFQFKIIHNISACNVWLKKMKIKDTDICEKCGNDKETLTHLYWECPGIQTFLNCLFIFLKQFKFNSKMDMINFILGQNIEKSELILFQIFGMAKWYIFKCKLGDTTLNNDSFIFELRSTFHTEKIVAKNRGEGSQNKFNYKWKNFLDSWSSRNLID